MHRELETLRTSLAEYIQATYHISHPALVEQRRALLSEPRTLQQAPWIESAARYQTLESHEAAAIPAHLRAFFRRLVDAGLAFPPYSHQAQALERVLGHERADLVVTTGTGSGKTETFLHPVLARIYDEAATRPDRFARRAIRALVLYPMNALVNDQLGRLRTLFGADVVRAAFVEAAGRPAKFARYTGRTLFPGRTPGDTQKLAARLKPLRFYMKLADEARDADPQKAAGTRRLIEVLKAKGRWPSKPDLERWFLGGGGRRWVVNGERVRAVERPDDAELLLRQEVQAAVPDLFMTNYSMLEYTLLRPIERSIWQQTADYYAEHPDEQLVLVLDEAHLYRGASGTEVALLIRRLKARLGLSEDQLRVICTSASFDDPEQAKRFAAELSGRRAEGFVTLTGDKRPHLPSGPGGDEFCAALAATPAHDVLASEPDTRASLLAQLYRALGEAPPSALDDGVLGPELHRLLAALPVTGRLLNLTSAARCEDDPETHPHRAPAKEVGALSAALFPSVAPTLARGATDALLELTAAARPSPGQPPLLAARVHAFFRALPGVWVCVNPACSGLPAHLHGGPSGKMYFEPRVRCDDCAARVFELHTCRDCGLAMATAYARDAAAPHFLWPEPGGALEDEAASLAKVHLVLEPPTERGDGPGAVLDYLGIMSARLGVLDGRQVWRAADGEFATCPRCSGQGHKISGHATAGDQPFQALVTSQLKAQPPVPGSRTPLRGRKVMIFSDGRQAASRLSGNLKAYSLRDAIRPLLLLGARWLEQRGVVPTLDLAFAAVVVGCELRAVTLPVAAEGADALRDAQARARRYLLVADAEPQELKDEAERIAELTPKDVLLALYEILFRPHTGLEALALGTFSVSLSGRGRRDVEELAAPPGEGDEAARRAALLQVWARHAAERRMIVLPGTPSERIDSERDYMARPHKIAADFLRERLPSKVFNAAFGRRGDWAPVIERTLVDGRPTAKGILVRASQIRLVLDDVNWCRCARCTRVQPASTVSDVCFGCKTRSLRPLEPASDPAFRARAGYYRSGTERVLDHDEQPFAFVAEEHSAQLGQAMDGELFARTERYELRFQDVEMPPEEGDSAGPVDVLSCTTTMEVGIDIGSLTGVALRNVPPGRANYQQRAGRAGRRGSSLATVLTWCSADSHDRRFYDDPAGMVSGPVRDPLLDLENRDIVQRHAYALMLGMYQLESVSDDEDAPANLFMSLGTVSGFRRGDTEAFSFRGLAAWLKERADEVEAALRRVVPDLHGEALIAQLPGMLLTALQEAGCGPDEEEAPSTAVSAPVVAGIFDEEDEAVTTATAEVGEAAGDTRLLLDRLFAKGVLPRYAFPTDVVTFHVFKSAAERKRDKVLKYAPQQGRGVGLSQYAPGREVWVDGQRWRSLGLFDTFQSHVKAWKAREAYLECTRCKFAKVVPLAEQHGARSCEACGAVMAPPVPWVVPVGFCHPVDQPPAVAGEDSPPRTRASRAKLDRPMSDRAPIWWSPSGRVAGWSGQDDLTLTNIGTTEADARADQTYFRYCPRCGRIEPNGWEDGAFAKPGGHPKPAPPLRNEPTTCEGYPDLITLGTRFRTDVAVFRLRFDAGYALRPGAAATGIVLTTLAEALTAAARAVLDLDEGEVAAEHRPALTGLGPTGEEVELYLYDAVPGGAGYARELCARGDELFQRALEIMECCTGDGTPDSPRPCDQSCYHCLRSFSNRWIHGDLHRHLGAAALRHALTGAPPTLAPDHQRHLLQGMAEWLEAEGEQAVVAGETLEVNGRAVQLRHPMARATEGTICALLAERALPNACGLALAFATGADAGPPELPLPETDAGLPVYDSLRALCVDAPTARRVSPPHDLPDAIALVRLSPRLRELHEELKQLADASWVVVGPAPAELPDKPLLVVLELSGGPEVPQRAFHGTQERQTMALTRRREEDLIVTYKTRSAWGRTETLPAAWVQLRFTVLRGLS